MLVAVGFGGVSLSRSLIVLLGSALIAGYGHGAINLCGNLTIAAIFREKRVTAVNFINVFYGLGAFVGPALVGLAVAKLDVGIPVLWLGAFLIFAGSLLMIRIAPPQVEQSGKAAAPGRKLAVYASLILWALAFVSLFYGGSETGMAGWTTTYLQQSVRFSLEKAAFVTSGFYVMLTLGRILCSWLGSKLSGAQVLTATLATTVLGAIFFIAGYANPILSVIGIFVIGLGYGGIYPTLVALTTVIFPQATGRVAGLVISMGSIGGMLLPSLQGVIMEGRGPRPAGWMIAAEAFMMFILLLFARWRLTHSKPSPQVVKE
ncbi:MFS transporter [bacterium]|nr:MFS transporter [bacterium]